MLSCCCRTLTRFSWFDEDNGARSDSESESDSGGFRRFLVAGLLLSVADLDLEDTDLVGPCEFSNKKLSRSSSSSDDSDKK